MVQNDCLIQAGPNSLGLSEFLLPWLWAGAPGRIPHPRCGETSQYKASRSLSLYPCLIQLNHGFSYLLLLGPEISEASKSLNSHRSWKRKQPLKLPLKGYRGLPGQTWPFKMHRSVREMQAPHPTLAEEGKPSQPDPIYPQRRPAESPSNAAGLFLSWSDSSLVTA